MHLFDILFAALVVLPWIADDFSYNLGGFTIALSDVSIPFVVVGLVAAMVERWPSDPRSLLRACWVRLRDVVLHAPWTAAAMVAAAAVVAVGAEWWVRANPGLNLIIVTWKLTHGPSAALLALLAGVAARHWAGEPWTRSWFVRLAGRPAGAWLAAVRCAPARTLWLAAAAVGTGLLAVALLRHRAFESHGFDLGIFTNVMWNLTHGHGYYSSMKGGINLFADHQSPLFWLLAPLFRVAPRPETLLAAQAFGLAAGGPALYYLARRYFGAAHWASAALPWLYWTYLPLRNANAFDFHPEVFMLPLFLWAFVGFASERQRGRWLGVLALLGALAAKESASVVAFGIGLACILAAGSEMRCGRRLGVALVTAGVALFAFDVKVVPHLLGTDYAYLDLYDRFGGGLGGLLLAPFVQPAYFVSQLIDRERLNFLFWTLAPLGFLPLFNWRAAIAVLPAYLALFLTEGDQRVRIVFHYGIEPGTALFWALPVGLSAFVKRYGWQNAGTWMLAWAIAAHGASEWTRARSNDRFPEAAWLGTQVVPCLDREASMAASDSLVPHLATRSWISYPDQLREQRSGKPVSCVVIDLDVDNWPLGRQVASRVAPALTEKGYRLAWKCNGVSVYELGTATCLRCMPQCY